MGSCDLKKKYDELKAIVDHPKLYLVNCFDEIRNEIDIECAKYLDKKNLAQELKEKAIEQQQEMIDELEAFQRQCLANRNCSNPNDQSQLDELEQRLKFVDKNGVSDLEKDLTCAIYNRKKMLFMNQGVIFNTTNEHKKLLIYRSNFRDILFGLLILIEDEFLIKSEKLLEWNGW